MRRAKKSGKRETRRREEERRERGREAKCLRGEVLGD